LVRELGLGLRLVGDGEILATAAGVEPATENRRKEIEVRV
jgi:hypothetical protein